MTTEEVMAIVKDRGMSIRLRDGQLFIVKEQGSDGLTPSLVAVLKFHRDKILEMLKHEEAKEPK